MILQNLYKLKNFGKSGNADPHYTNDWEEVELGTDNFYNKGIWNDPSGTCELPSLHVIEVFYQKINTLEDPQYTILSIKHSS